MRYRPPPELAARVAARPVDPAVLSRVLAHAPGGVVVFDLDSTLLDNRPRQARIMREFGAAHGHAPLLGAGPEHMQGWSIKLALHNAGLPEPEADALSRPAKAFWLERFFTSDYCVDDIAIAGATDYVRRIAETGARIVYCTGRHQPEMRPGTIESFSREGFPLPDDERVHLLMKPEFSMHDDEWKRIVRAQLEALGEVVAAFDNEPTHINTYREAFPGAQCVHILTDDSARGIPVLDDIPSVQDFRLP